MRSARHARNPGRPAPPRPAARRLIVAAIVIGLALAPTPAPALIEVPPHRDRSVHDLAGVLGAADVAAMERRHGELLDKTGAALVLITVPRLDGEPIGDFAVRVGTAWGAGRKGEDRGIVVAFALEEARVFVATGYGVESFLPDGRVGALLDQHYVPGRRAGDFAGALLATDMALVRACADHYGVAIEGVPRAARRHRERIPGPLAILIILVLAATVLPIMIRLATIGGGGFAGRGPRRGGGWYGGGWPGGFGGGGFGGGGLGGGFGGFGGGGFGGGGAGR